MKTIVVLSVVILVLGFVLATGNLWNTLLLVGVEKNTKETNRDNPLADIQSRSLAANAVGTTLGVLPPPTPELTASIQLWKLHTSGAGIDLARLLEVERYWSEYYSAQ